MTYNTNENEQTPCEIVLGIGDTQYPFAHRDHLEFLDAVKKKFHPTQVVHIGDEVDFHAISDYDHDPDGASAGDEFKAALKDMARLYEVFKKVKVCVSNHTSRPYRKALKHGIPKVFIKDYKDFLEAPKGWEWADRWEIDGILYEHGEGLAGVHAHRYAAERNMQSTVMGHLHSNAGVHYIASHRALIFGFALGCLIDRDAYAFAYGKHERRKPILGCGIINRGVPMFIPMKLQPGGRWIGKL